MSNPYLDLGAQAYWRTAVAEASPAHLEEIFQPKFSINPDWKIVTAGSCFAQHIARALRTHKYKILDGEPAPVGLSDANRQRYGYGLYSARYGNIYTTAFLHQLAQEITGEFEPKDWIWRKGDKFVDGLRPNVEPVGLASADEVREHRIFHLQQVEKVFREMDLFVFTMGLTEAWRHKSSGTVFPMAPGTIAGSFDEDSYEFVNFRYPEILRSFSGFMKTLRQIRGRKLPKVIVTVSPVPLTATASGQHILRANTYSKSTLRIVAEELSQRGDQIDYFPSFEIITNPAARGENYETNLRSVRTTSVEVVLKHFMAAYGNTDASAQLDGVAATAKKAESVPEDLREADDVVCEEVMLEAFSK